MDDRILCVDDEPQVLSALERSLRRDFSIVTAPGGSEALELMRTAGPFAVVLSDQRMPRMSGIELLRQVAALSPDTVRVMLTGDGDLQTAVKAINEGSIFRFLTKPCGDEVLMPALKASLEHYRLVTAERTLLERTLNGLAQVLSEVLGLVNHVAHDRAHRVRRYALHIGRALHVDPLWQIELAALLSQLGCVTIAPDLLQALYTGEPLGPTDLARVSKHPTVAGDLLQRIPRLEGVARIVASQASQRFDSEAERAPRGQRNPIVLASQVLRTALDFDRMVSAGAATDAALNALASHPRDYDPALLETLRQFRPPELVYEVRRVRFHTLDVGMVLEEDLRNATGMLLVPKGQTLTRPLLHRLRTAHSQGMTPDDLLVRAPRHDLH